MTEPAKSTEPRRRKRQFTIRAMLFATFLVAIAAAGFSGLIRTEPDGGPTPFFLFIVAAPLALLLASGLLRAIQRLLATRKGSGRDAGFEP